jgi:hypothetical protein
MKYQWDNNKAEQNEGKHGLCFSDAKYVFAGEIVTFIDKRRDYGEIRYITMGKLSGRIVVIVHTQRENTTRIISMRKANGREKKIYSKRLRKARSFE